MIFSSYENKFPKEAFISLIDLSYGHYNPLKKIKVN